MNHINTAKISTVKKLVRVLDWDRPSRETPEEEKSRINAEWAIKKEEYRLWCIAHQLPFPSDDDDDVEQYAQFDIDHHLAKLRKSSPNSTHSATGPLWNDTIEHWLVGYENDGVLAKGDTDVSITFKFALPEGSFSVRYETKRTQPIRNGKREEIEVHLERECRLVVKSGDGVFSGTLSEDFAGDMSARFVSLRGAPQHLADMVAKVYERIIDCDPEKDLPTFLAPFNKCIACSRPLDDIVSKAIGFGPTCAKGHGIRHTLEAANYTIQQRALHTEWLKSLDLPEWLKPVVAA